MAVNLVTYIENFDREKEVSISDLPSKPPLLSIPPMDGRIICFYGFRPVVESMKAVRLDAIKRGVNITRVSVFAKNENDPRGTLESLPNLEAISIWRADNSLRQQIAKTLMKSIGREHKGEIVESHTIDELFSLDPSLFNILWDDPLFAHINVFLWRGRYNCATQLGVIRDRSVIEKIDVTR